MEAIRARLVPLTFEMRTLIYKRTHDGDPDADGRFGVYNCMGRVRSLNFDAVIGVGGIGSEPTRLGLAHKINWIGVGAHKHRVVRLRWPIVMFDRFLFFGKEGPRCDQVAPILANRMYANNVRYVMNCLDSLERREIDKILALAKNAPPSRAPITRPPAICGRERATSGQKAR